MTNQSALLIRLELLEKEIADIRKRILAEPPTEQVTIRGLWAGYEVTEEDFEAAEKSLFPEIDDL